MPLAILSFLTINSVNSRIESVLEQNLLNYAHGSEVIYNSHLDRILKLGIMLSENSQFAENVANGDTSALKDQMVQFAKSEGIDIATLIDPNGLALARINSNVTGDDFALGGLTRYAALRRIPIASTEIIPSAELAIEGESLLLSARTRRIPTLYQKTDDGNPYESNGMAIIAAVPIVKDRKVIAVIVVADLLNRDYRIPDEIKKILGADISIFQEDVRVSTTLSTKRGNRYVGTLLFEPVYNKTLVNGETYLGRVWAVNNWGKAAFVPIKNYMGEVIGVMGIEVPEAEFRQSQFFSQKTDIAQIIIITTIAVLLVSFGITFWVSKKLTEPVDRLIESANEVIKGNFEQGVKINSYDEINNLANAFNIMIRYLRKNMVKKEREILEQYKKVKGK
jgi:methyl-accepting chemotaxis protein